MRGCPRDERCARAEGGVATAMARLVMLLAYPGLLLYTIGATFVVLRLQFECATATTCPTSADPSTLLTTRLQTEGRVALVGALVLVLAWLLCLVALWRKDHRWGFFALLLALPLGLWLAGIAVLSAAS